MKPEEIMDGVPVEDAPDAKEKPKNNLWTWLVGVLTVAVVTLWGVTMSSKNEQIRNARSDATRDVQYWKGVANDWKVQDSQDRVKLEECNNEKLTIQGNGQQVLLEYLELKPGRKQTISIQPKKTQ